MESGLPAEAYCAPVIVRSGGVGSGGQDATLLGSDKPHRLLDWHTKKNAPGTILTVACVLNPLTLVNTGQLVGLPVKVGLPRKTNSESAVSGAPGVH